MKIFTIILLVIFGALALLGLIVFATYQSKGGSQVAQITVWGTLPKEAFDKTLKDFSREYPAFARVTYVHKDPEIFIEDFTEALSVGKGPDLLLVSSDLIVPNEKKIRAIGGSATRPRTFRDTYIEATEPLLVSGGALMMPFLLDPLVMYYNRSLLSNAGVSIPPATWEAVASLSERMTKRTVGGASIDVATVAFGTYSNVPYARDILSLLFFQAGSSIMELGDNGKYAATLRNGNTVSALRFYTDFSNPLKSVYSWNSSLSNAFNQFIAGDLAFYVAPFSERVRIEAGAPNLNVDMTVVPHPQTATTQVTTGALYGFVLPLASPHPNDAMTVVGYLSEKPVVTALARAFNMISVRRDGLLVDEGTDPFVSVGNRSALLMRIWLSPSAVAVDRIFGTMVDSVRSGLATPEEAVIVGTAALQNEVK